MNLGVAVYAAAIEDSLVGKVTIGKVSPDEEVVEMIHDLFK